MHTLFTTEAFLFESTPTGESSALLRLFTEQFGMILVHAQGVRNLQNKNKYALTVGARAQVTMVRGRELWRLTSAQEVYDKARSGLITRELIDVCLRIITHEEKNTELYNVVAHAHEALCMHGARYRTCIEEIAIARVLYHSGYIAHTDHGIILKKVLTDTSYDISLLRFVYPHIRAFHQITRGTFNRITT